MVAVAGIAYLAAFIFLLLLLWILRDMLLPKIQEFEKNEWDSLNLLRHEIEHMEAAIKRHLELADSARQNFTNTEGKMVREVYAQTTMRLQQLGYDRNIFVDKAITRPGQRCYDIYLRLSRADIPLGFLEAPLPLEFKEAEGRDIAVDTDEIAVVPSAEQCAELHLLTTKFAMAKNRLFNRLDVYKKRQPQKS